MKGLPVQTRRQFLRHTAFFAGAAAALPLPGALAAPGTGANATPVILATDIGDDIDDTWALGLLLRSPELDLKLVVGDYGKRLYRARLLARLLQTFGHGHVPVGLGLDIDPRGEGGQAAWIKDYDLKSYPGKVHEDGVQAIIDTIQKSPVPVTVIAIGPMPNIAAALQREPAIARNARLVGMYGSVRKGYDGTANVSPEWNVKADPKSCQAALSAPWDITITPLDTCGRISLEGERYARVRDSKDPVAATVVENYRCWCQSGDPNNKAADTHSSVLFDTVAVYLAISQQFCRMERLGIRVTDDGFTRVDDQAKVMNVATEWKDLDGYRDFLVARLTGAGH